MVDMDRYGRYCLVDILTMVYKPTNITGGAPPCMLCYVAFVFVCSNYYPSTIWLFNIAMENGP